MIVGDDLPTLLSNTVPVAGQPLTFKTQGLGQPRDVTLIPFYQVQHQRYSVYWSLMSATNWQQFANSNAVAEAGTIDQVSIGDPTSEAAHDLVATNSTNGTFNEMNWRDANEALSPTGSFGYTMAVLPGTSNSLACTFWGSDTGGRVFDIIVDGTVIATETLTNDDPGNFFTVDYALPLNLTAGQTNITVLFQAHAGQMAGGLFGLQTVTTANPGEFLGISMSLPSMQNLGAPAPLAGVVDNFQNLANHPINSSPWLVLSSSNTNVITTGPNNTLLAVGTGTATITANYLGYEVSQVITVTLPPLQINVIGTNAIISWPGTGVTLQSVLDLWSGSVWSPLTNSITYANGTNSLAVPITNNARYFRLAP
jgi:hypothetical protein